MKSIVTVMTLCIGLTLSLFAGAEADDSVMREKAMAAVRAAIPKAESDPARPVYHFRPPAQLMKDICGAIYFKGYYHIFYLSDPFSDEGSGKNYTAWGHARSKDLVYWEDLPWALLPMKGRGERRCNSGCVALDDNNRPMIFYTFVPSRKDATRLGKREQWGAKPLDDGLIKWRRVKDGPLMAAGMNGVPASIKRGWSDPFVFRSDGRTFVTFKDSYGVVCEAQDKELTQWKFAGNIEGVDGECPNFFSMQQKWMLLRSMGPPSYVVGDFDANEIRFHHESSGVLDYAQLYATNVLTDPDGRRIMVGWICGFKPGRGWKGCMSLPRVLTLDTNNNLIQTPAPELKKLRGQHRRIENLNVVSATDRLDGIEGDTMEIVAEFALSNAAAFGLQVRCSDDGTNALTLRYAEGKLDVFGTMVPITLDDNAKTLKLHVFLDRAVSEVFVNDGRACVARVNYPGEKDLGVSVFAENGSATLKSFDAWEMKPIW